jgi:hypothetical protein
MKDHTDVNHKLYQTIGQDLTVVLSIAHDMTGLIAIGSHLVVELGTMIVSAKMPMDTIDDARGKRAIRLAVMPHCQCRDYLQQPAFAQLQKAAYWSLTGLRE